MHCYTVDLGKVWQVNCTSPLRSDVKRSLYNSTAATATNRVLWKETNKQQRQLLSSYNSSQYKKVRVPGTYSALMSLYGTTTSRYLPTSNWYLVHTPKTIASRTRTKFRAFCLIFVILCLSVDLAFLTAINEVTQTSLYYKQLLSCIFLIPSDYQATGKIKLIVFVEN